MAKEAIHNEAKGSRLYFYTMKSASILSVFLMLVFSCLVVAIPFKEKQSQYEPELHIDDKRSVESEEEVNEKEDVDLFEGDIFLTDEDKEVVDLRDSGDVDGPLKTQKRNAIYHRNNLWTTRTVPYVKDSSLGSTALNAINQAINNYHMHTCIKWTQWTGSGHYAKFIRKSGCWSTVGRKTSSLGYQEISIGPGCETTGIVMHEMMHALGFWHAQSRPDRNQYIEIMWENIIGGKEHNFNKYAHQDVDLLGLPYDFDSLMHYRNTYFSKNGKNTIQKIGNPHVTLGQKNGFSTNDKLQLNRLYSCSTPNGQWSEWSSWTPCDSSCKKSRRSFCTRAYPEPCEGTSTYHVLKVQPASCSHQECYKPVDGHWGRWSAWSSCSKTCDIGVQSRTRLCDDPTPKNGGAACTGLSRQWQNCLVIRCNAGPDDCEFENPSKPFCDWTQDTSDTHTDHPDWIRISGQTPTDATGPTGDHTLGTGHYIYGEGSHCSNGKVVRLLSKYYPWTYGRCMSFWYSMYGQDMGYFNIYTQSYPTGYMTKIFTRSGNQGTSWIKGRAFIKSPVTYRIVLEMVCGSSYKSDVAVDDIAFHYGYC